MEEALDLSFDRLLLMMMMMMSRMAVNGCSALQRIPVRRLSWALDEGGAVSQSDCI